MFGLITEMMDFVVPIYTIIAVIFIFVYHNRKDTNESEKKTYKIVRKVKETKEADPNDWKKLFAGNWNLQRRDGLKDVSYI